MIRLTQFLKYPSKTTRIIASAPYLSRNSRSYNLCLHQNLHVVPAISMGTSSPSRSSIYKRESSCSNRAPLYLPTFYPNVVLQRSSFSSGPQRNSGSGHRREDPNHRPPNGDGGGNPRMGMLASLGMGASLLAGKTKYLFVALKLTKMAPLASMVISSFAYSLVFGWPYAIGMVGLIFGHELGHLLVMRYYGVPFSPMVFVPFMGAVIAMKDEPRNATEEAFIAFGGPALGTATAFGVGMAGAATDSQLLYALADFGYMINLFNLLPIGSLDGGRIGNAISPYFGVLGLAAGGGLIYTSAVSNPIFYLIMLGGGYSTATRLFGWEEKKKYEDYYDIPRTQQGLILSSYVGLIATLLYLMHENNQQRLTPHELDAIRLQQIDHYGPEGAATAAEEGEDISKDSDGIAQSRKEFEKEARKAWLEQRKRDIAAGKCVVVYDNFFSEPDEE